MKSEQLIDYLGYSIKSEPLEELIRELKIDTELRAFHKSKNPKYKIDLRNESNDIILIFDGYIRYKEEYGEPKIIIDSSGDELILAQIYFHNEDENATKPFSIELPFELKFKDSMENVINKIGKKPSLKQKTDKGFCLIFKMNEYELIVFLNESSKLIMLRIIKYGKREMEKIKLKQELSSQRKNLKPENSEKIQFLREELPTKDWRKRMREGDNIFTVKNIDGVELILLEYIEKISQYTKDKKASNIFNSVKKVTKRINQVNDKYNYFIDTLEREEICEFIDKVIKTTGFEVKNGVDLTEEWREW